MALKTNSFRNPCKRTLGSIRIVLYSILFTVFMIFTEVEITLINVCGISPHFGTAKCRKLETRAVGKFDKEHFSRYIC
jgi:hypothetical protein